MSTFQVQLQNIEQGKLDLDPSTHPLAAGSAATYGKLGAAFTTSKQRQVWVAGPKGTYRLLIDGETFTDCNYWKRFCYPQVTREFAFLTCTSDDGSVYSDVEEENTFAVGATLTMAADYSTANTVDFVTTHGGAARFLQVQNLSGSNSVIGELNGDVNVTFTLGTNETQIFNQGDLAITQLRLKGTAGQAASYIASVKSAVNS